MGTYKLVLDDDLGYDFSLVAIHGSIEPYYLAYLLNKNLGTKLARSKKDLEVNAASFSATFPLYEYDDEQQYVTYHLFSNRTRTTKTSVVNAGLFNDQKVNAGNSFFLAEMPKVDFWLKIYDDGSAFAKAKTLKTLNQIPQVVTAYTVDVNQLKTKENLIFE